MPAIRQLLVRMNAENTLPSASQPMASMAPLDIAKATSSALRTRVGWLRLSTSTSLPTPLTSVGTPRGPGALRPGHDHRLGLHQGVEHVRADESNVRALPDDANTVIRPCPER